MAGIEHSCSHSSVKTLFQKTHESGELGWFASGQQEYFKLDREHGEHWVLGSWKEEILPAAKKYDPEELQLLLCQMLSDLTKNESISEQVRLDLFLYHLSVFYYLKCEGHFSSDFFANCNFDICSYISDAVKRHNTPEKVRSAIAQIQKRGGLKTFQ
jgi:hypothetical protein